MYLDRLNKTLKILKVKSLIYNNSIIVLFMMIYYQCY